LWFPAAEGCFGFGGTRALLVWHGALAKVGAQPAPGSPQDFASFIAAETRKWSAIAKTSGISLD
jgi:hypothetical protein